MEIAADNKGVVYVVKREKDRWPKAEQVSRQSCDSGCADPAESSEDHAIENRRSRIYQNLSTDTLLPSPYQKPESISAMDDPISNLSDIINGSSCPRETEPRSGGRNLSRNSPFGILCRRAVPRSHPVAPPVDDFFPRAVHLFSV
jgi:hypothetical protein